MTTTMTFEEVMAIDTCDRSITSETLTDVFRTRLWAAKADFDTMLRADKINENVMGDAIRSFVQLEALLVKAGFGTALGIHRNVLNRYVPDGGYSASEPTPLTEAEQRKAERVVAGEDGDPDDRLH